MLLPLPAITLLPHKGPMCCLDVLIHATTTTAKAMVTLTPGHVLLQEGGMITPAGYIELAAQTAGALQGYEQLQSSTGPRTGYLVAVQNFEVLAPAYVENILIISVVVQKELEGVSIILAEVLHNGHILAHCKLKVFVKEEL